MLIGVTLQQRVEVALHGIDAAINVGIDTDDSVPSASGSSTGSSPTSCRFNASREFSASRRSSRALAATG
jgi:hypothetical protein